MHNDKQSLTHHADPSHNYVTVQKTSYLTAEVSLAVLSDNILMAPSSSPSKPFEQNRIY